MNKSNQTHRKIEQILSDRIETLYRQYFGDRFVSASCHLFNATIVIVIECHILPVEERLGSQGKEHSVTLFRLELEKSLQRRIRDSIEEIFHLTVVDLLTDTNQNTGRTGLIVVLERDPHLLL